MISIESATTPHSFNLLLLLLLLLLPQNPVSSIQMRLFFLYYNHVCPVLFFFMWKGAYLGPLKPLGSRSRAPAGAKKASGSKSNAALGTLWPLGLRSSAPTGPLRPLGPRFSRVGSKQKKKNIFLKPLKSDPAGALIGYHENQCVFS